MLVNRDGRSWPLRLRALLAGIRQVDRGGGPFYGPANFAGGLCQRAAPPCFSAEMDGLL